MAVLVLYRESVGGREGSLDMLSAGAEVLGVDESVSVCAWWWAPMCGSAVFGINSRVYDEGRGPSWAEAEVCEVTVAIDSVENPGEGGISSDTTDRRPLFSSTCCSRTGAWRGIGGSATTSTGELASSIDRFARLSASHVSHCHSSKCVRP